MCVGLAGNHAMVMAKDNKKVKSKASNSSYPVAVNQRGVNQSHAYSPDLIKVKVDAIASYYRLDPRLVRNIVEQESSFNPNARSSADAMGLMQMIPSTARRFGVKNPYDPDESLHGGCRYFVWLLRRYNGRLDLALAGYNAGEGAVERHGNRVPPYKETQDYVKSITNKYLVKLGVKRTNHTKTNQIANKPNQAFKPVSNQNNRGYKSTQARTKQQLQRKGDSTSPKTTKEGLDVLDTYFQKSKF